MQIHLPTMSGNAESTMGTVLLRTMTTPIPEGVPIPDGLPKLRRVPGKNDSRVRDNELCPYCGGLRFVPERGEVVRCPYCKGGAMAPAVVHVAVVEDADTTGMPKTTEVIKAFVGIDGVRIDGMLMLKANASGADPNDRNHGTARIWVTTDGKAFPPPRVIEPYGFVFETKKAVLFYLDRMAEGGTGWVEFLTATEGKVWREKLINYRFQFAGNAVDEVETYSGVELNENGREQFGGYCSHTAMLLCQEPSWNIQLGAIFHKALPLAVQKSKEPNDPTERLRRVWAGKERPRDERRPRREPEKPKPTPQTTESGPAAPVEVEQKCFMCGSTETVETRPVDGKDEPVCAKCRDGLGLEDTVSVSTKCCNCDGEGVEREVAEGRKMVLCDGCWGSLAAAQPGAEEKPKKRARRKQPEQAQKQE